MSNVMSKSNMLIMNIVLRIDYLDPRLNIRANLVPTLKFVSTFMKFGTQNKSNMLTMQARRNEKNWGRGGEGESLSKNLRQFD